MSKRQLKSIDIDFFKKNKNITFYLIMIVFNDSIFNLSINK